MSEPMLTVHNIHDPAMGDPPIVRKRHGLYVSYFEGSCGDQWIFEFDRKTRKVKLRGGDVGWTETFEVKRGKVVGTLLLGPEEAQWIAAAWAAATDFGRLA